MIPRMSGKVLRHNAPGETRTPNLLIRSQFLGWLSKGSGRAPVQEAATQTPKADNASHNNSHNTSPLRRSAA